MKKNAFSLIVFAVFLAFAGFVFADEAISFPNPLGNVNDFPTLIQNVATYITTIVGALAVLMFIWAGILFITAAMFPGNYERAKNALWWAVIGLIIALSAMGLIQVVRQVLGGQGQGGQGGGGRGDDVPPPCVPSGRVCRGGNINECCGGQACIRNQGDANAHCSGCGLSGCPAGQRCDFSTGVCN